MKPILLFLFGMLFFSLVSAQAQSSTVIVPAGQIYTYILNLDQGDQVQLHVSITGGDNTVNCTLRDPPGDMEYSNDMVPGGFNYDFQSEYAGAHKLIFDNTNSSDDKIVNIYYYIIPSKQDKGACASAFILIGILGLLLITRSS